MELDVALLDFVPDNDLSRPKPCAAGSFDITFKPLVIDLVDDVHFVDSHDWLTL